MHTCPWSRYDRDPNPQSNLSGQLSYVLDTRMECRLDGQALKHAGIAMGTNFKISTLAAEDISNDQDSNFDDAFSTPKSGINGSSRSRSPSPL